MTQSIFNYGLQPWVNISIWENFEHGWECSYKDLCKLIYGSIQKVASIP